jgi:hypothetical protein
VLVVLNDRGAEPVAEEVPVTAVAEVEQLGVDTV